MLTLPMPHSSSSPPVSLLKNAVPATGAEGARQTADAAGFGEVLAQEMNGRAHTAETGPADDKTAPDKVEEDTAVADKKRETRSLAAPEDNKEMGLNGVVIGLTPQPAALPGALPGLIAGHPSVALAGNGTDGRTPAGTAGTVKGTEAESPAETPQGERRATAGRHVEVAAVHAGLFAARSDAPGTAREPGAAAAHGITPQNAKVSADISADVLTRSGSKTKQAGAIQAIIQPDAMIKPGLGKGQGGQGALPHSPPLESGVPKFSLTGETEKPGKSFLEVAHPSLPAAPVDSAVTVLVAERGLASASPTAAASALPRAALGVEPHLGASGWDNALGQKVLWMVSQHQQVAELSLNPPELGPLQVVLSVTDDQVSATFVSQQADVRHALEASLPRLKEMMADNGMNLNNTTVSSETPQQQGGFEQQNRPGARYGGGGAQGQIARGIDMAASHVPSGGNSLVDTFA